MDNYGSSIFTVIVMPVALSSLTATALFGCAAALMPCLAAASGVARARSAALLTVPCKKLAAAGDRFRGIEQMQIGTRLCQQLGVGSVSKPELYSYNVGT